MSSKTSEELLSEQNDLIREQNELLRELPSRMPRKSLVQEAAENWDARQGAWGRLWWKNPYRR